MLVCIMKHRFHMIKIIVLLFLLYVDTSSICAYDVTYAYDASCAYDVSYAYDA